jgi:hypothetical protein
MSDSELASVDYLSLSSPVYAEGMVTRIGQLEPPFE